jgi:hypothetical protein
MAKQNVLVALLLATLLVAAACSDSNSDQTVTGKGSIRAIHAISDIGNVSFLIEETILAVLDYKEASGISEYDNLEYTFRFEIFLPGDTEPTVLATQTLNIDPEVEYTFVLTGSLANPEFVIWQQFGRNWAEELAITLENETEITVSEVSFANLSAIAGIVDVYLEAPGTSPLAANPIATIGNSDLQAAFEIPSGAYQLVLTPAGNATQIIYATDPMLVAAATSNLFTLMDDGGQSSADYTVRWVGGSGEFELFDLNLKPDISVVHAALGSGSIDVIVGGDFANPLVVDLDFTEQSGTSTIDAGTLNVNVTPTGNSGVFLEQQAYNIARGDITRMYMVGFPGDLQAVLMPNDRRGLATHARLRVFQGAKRYNTVDLYIVGTEIDISLISPSYSSFLFGTSTGLVARVPDEYNLFVTEAGTKNVTGGPYLLDLAAHQNTEVVVVDSSSITMTEAMIFDLPTE